MFDVGLRPSHNDFGQLPLKRSVFCVFGYIGGVRGQKGGGVREANLEHSVPYSEASSEAHQTTCVVG